MYPESREREDSMRGGNKESLVKETVKGEVVWTIILDDEALTTQITSTIEGRNGRKLAPMTHRTLDVARTFMTRQINLKIKQGYNRSRTKMWTTDADSDGDATMTGDVTNDPPDTCHINQEAFSFNPRNLGHLPSNYKRKSDLLKRKSDFGDRNPQSKKKRRTMEEEIFYANRRADALKRGEPAPVDTDDTDSIASSESSFSVVKKVRVGLSPLKKRRSLRLALKRGASIMDTSTGLTKQNTVQMTSPRILEKMDTNSKWSNWRTNSQGKMSVRGSARSINRMDTLPVSKEETMKPQMLKKLSTTTGLRQMMAKTGLEYKIEIPNVFADETVPDTREAQEAIASPTAVMKRLGGKKSVNIMPSLEEGDCTSADTDDQTNELPFKRISKSPISPPAQLLTKRRKVSPAGAGSSSPRVFQPPTNKWPVNIESQVVWRVPLSGEDNGCGVCIIDTGCYIATKGGKVIVLDSGVNHTVTHELPQGIKFIDVDNGKVTCACMSGTFYEVSNVEWRLVNDLRNKSQVLGFAVYNGILFISKPKGILLTYNLHTEELTRTCTKKNLGDWILVDVTGIYVGHSGGVCKYSHLSRKDVLWETTLSDKPPAAALYNGSLYLGCQDGLIKLDSSTGEIIKKYNDPEPRSENVDVIGVNVTCGGGMLFYMDGNSLKCYDEECGQLVYKLTPPSSKCLQIKFYKGRLFYLGENCLSVIDFSRDIIHSAMDGVNHAPVDIHVGPHPPIRTLLKKSSTLSVRSLKRKAIGGHVNEPPAQRRCVLKNKVLTLGHTSS